MDDLAEAFDTFTILTAAVVTGAQARLDELDARVTALEQGA